MPVASKCVGILNGAVAGGRWIDRGWGGALRCASVRRRGELSLRDLMLGRNLDTGTRQQSVMTATMMRYSLQGRQLI